MAYDLQYIRELTQRELSGIISDEDRAYLHKAISEDKDAYAMHQAMTNLFHSEEFQSYYHDLDDLSFMNAPKARVKQRRLYSRIAAAATVIVLLGLATIAFIRYNSPTTTVAPSAQSNKPGIALKLPGGQVLNLSADSGRLQAAGLTLNNTAKTLSYNITDMEQASGLSRIAVPIGLDYHLSLSDGTQVWLNSATDMEFPFSFPNGSREITINGEAYLEVAPDSKRPFIVHLPDGNQVQVLGTAFNVNTYISRQMQVALVSGAVKLKTGRDSLTLKPGKQATYIAGQSIQVSAFDTDDVLGWRDGIYYFHNATLSEISRVLPRWYGIEVVMDNAPAARQTFTGAINRKEPVEYLLARLHELLGTEYYYKGEVLHFK